MHTAILCGIFLFAVFSPNVDGNDPKTDSSAKKENSARNIPTIIRFDDSRRNPASVQDKKMVLIPITNVYLSQELMEINDRLIMQGGAKSLTKKQGEWINRFVTSLRNWLYLIHAILKTTKFKEVYEEHLDKDFDLWITGRNHEAFDMIYQDTSNPKKRPLHYKLIIYRLSYSGIGYTNFNLKSFDIRFEKSLNKMQTSDGQMVFRKDRVYTIELEAELPITDIKIRHEIVEDKENGDFNPLLLEEKQDVKPGYLRLRLANVKIQVNLLLTEIDKRFVEADPETGEMYYFEIPKVVDFEFSIKQATMPAPELQTKPNLPEGFVGKGLTEARARIILKDFVKYIVLEEHRSELSSRLKTYLINRFSRSIMLSRNIFLLLDNLDYEGSYYQDYLPYVPNERDLRKLAGKDVDESTLSPEELEKKKKKDAEIQAKGVEIQEKINDWVEKQSEMAIKGISILDDGFDWGEDGSLVDFDIIRSPVLKEINEEGSASSEAEIQPTEGTDPVNKEGSDGSVSSQTVAQPLVNPSDNSMENKPLKPEGNQGLLQEGKDAIHDT